jgi:stage II sporulation protein D
MARAKPALDTAADALGDITASGPDRRLMARVSRFTRPRVSSIVLAALAVVVGAVAPAAASGPIRVALAESVRAAELRGVEIEVTPLFVEACDECGLRPWRTDVVRAVWADGAVEIDGRRAPGFRLRGAGPIRLGGREYPAVLELLAHGAGLAIVNELALEEYLVGVLRAEAGERWPHEALRAQAIVARTYAAYHRLLNAGKPFHLVASSAHQQYAGVVPAPSSAWPAVQQTAGQVLLWEGEVFPAFYHADSGGYTEDPRQVFTAPNMPALTAIVCPFSARSPHSSWSLDLRLPDLADLLRRTGADVGRVTAIEIAERARSLRAMAVTVRGTGGAVRLRGNDFRRLVGYDTLKSTLFEVVVDRDVARFSGRGYGHGVGLCQWGARGMAEQGHPAPRILEFYYPGTTLGFLNGR